MTVRLLCWLLLAAGYAPAQLQVVVIQGGSERDPGALVDLGTIDAGTILDTPFRVRNTGAAAQQVQPISVAGAAFSIERAPAATVSLASGQALDFVVRFQPTGAGSYSAILNVNAATFLLRGSAGRAIVVWLERAGKRSLCPPGTPIDFGGVTTGARGTVRALLENNSTEPLSFDIAILGAAFHGPPAMTSPVTLGANASAWLEIVFEPGSTGAAEGLLTIGTHGYPLLGTGLNPPLPKAALVFQPAAPKSGQQPKVVVRLDSKSPIAAAGHILLDFLPAVTLGPDDPAIVFLATSGRGVEFTVAKGEDFARVAGRQEIEFQTGTTAGALVFTLEWPGETARAKLVIAAEPVSTDSRQASRSAGTLEVRITGFDNSRTASQLAFTFFDQSGTAVAPGRIALDAAADFRRYFETGGAGGAFALRAVFPVTGDASGVSAVEVEITNTAGATRTGRIPIS